MNGRKQPLRWHAPGRGSRAQLEWVHRNRQGRARFQALGDLVRDLDVAGAGVNRAGRRVFEALCELVDDDFRRCCSFLDYSGQEVRILVNAPEMLYHIRTKWQAVLPARLRQVCPQVKVKRVSFHPVGQDDPDRPAQAGAAF